MPNVDLMRWTRRLPPRHAWFWAIAAWMYAGSAWMVRVHTHIAPAPVPEWPLAFDLLLTLPLAYLALNRHDWRKALPVVGSLLVAGYWWGLWWLPSDDQVLWSWLGDARWVVLAALLAWQLSVFARIARAVVRTPPAHNAETTAVATMGRQFAAQPLMATWLAIEARLWIYALMRRPVRTSFEGDAHFTVHRQHGNASNQQGFLVLLGAEIPILHALLHLWLGPVTAWVISALSVYGWLFMWADYRATRLRPVSVHAQALHIRYGLLIDLVVPRATIEHVASVRGPVPQTKGRLCLWGLGAPDVCITLREGATLDLPWGTRPVREIVLGIDQPAAFCDAMQDSKAKE